MSIRNEVIKALREELATICDNLEVALPEDIENMSNVELIIRHSRSAVYADGVVVCTVDGRTSTTFSIDYHEKLWRGIEDVTDEGRPLSSE